ncbi:hypothetical protein BGW36DRAFT_19979 [Talaromyces proteolyticus]|uniref:Uncharacterized protein n=1 Tax=Talaromyces proteolyticus TaxID=1131652 RepID=A0AAD4L3J7_9EURO|nr:uncharacterized protein BGW36DRAFT_19979 [Talaromyces proteolyticus]KAH8705936.1 hypothetical protein BGW36DRAFT_19979 [Talaromyces proteolyticus]
MTPTSLSLRPSDATNSLSQRELSSHKLSSDENNQPFRPVGRRLKRRRVIEDSEDDEPAVDTNSAVGNNPEPVHREPSSDETPQLANRHGQDLRVIADPDDEDEPIGKGMDPMVTPRAQKNDTSTPPPLPSPSAFTSNFVLDELLEEEEDLEDAAPELDDEDVLYESGDEEEDDDVVLSLHDDSGVLEGQKGDSFATLLRSIITALVLWTNQHDVSKIVGRMRPITLGFWSLLTRVDIDLLMALYLPAIPRQVMRLFEKSSWSLDDLMSLPSVRGISKYGVYGNFPTGNLSVRTDSSPGCECYIGSTQCLDTRADQHQRLAKKEVNDLPKSHKRSLHYNQICREGVKSHFRALAVFEQPVAKGYLNLLEGIFMILFQTYRYRRYHEHAPKASFDLFDEISGVVKIPSSACTWRGLNGAWPLRQGFFHPSWKKSLSCHNAACSRMTIPGRRYLFAPFDPLGPYICPLCYMYRRRYGNFPSSSFTESVNERIERTNKVRERRKAAGGDLACSCCSRVESQFPRNARGGTKIRLHRIHPKFPDMNLCRYCYMFVDEHNRLRSSEEIEQYSRIFDLIVARLGEGKVVCENCSAVDGHPTCRGQHRSNAETGLVLCTPCEEYQCHHHKLRDPFCQRRLEVVYEADQTRKRGEPVLCAFCHRPETAGGYKFSVSKKGRGPYCRIRNCRREAGADDDDDIADGGRRARLADTQRLHARQSDAGEDIICRYCGDVEGKGKSKKPYSITRNGYGPYCHRKKCRAEARAGRDPVYPTR